VASNSFPNLDVEAGNNADLLDGKGYQPALYLALANSGIGPARLRSVEVAYKDKSVNSLAEILAACCTKEPSESLHHTPHFFSGDTRGSMLQAGKKVNLFVWGKAADDPRWDRLEKARQEIRVTVCYCSVFDECYVRDSRKNEPEHVEACPVSKTPYGVGE